MHACMYVCMYVCTSTVLSQCVTYLICMNAWFCLVIGGKEHYNKIKFRVSIKHLVQSYFLWNVTHYLIILNDCMPLQNHHADYQAPSLDMVALLVTDINMVAMNHTVYLTMCRANFT